MFDLVYTCILTAFSVWESVVKHWDLTCQAAVMREPGQSDWNGITAKTIEYITR